MPSPSEKRTTPRGETKAPDPVRELRRFHLGEPGGEVRSLDPDHRLLPLHLLPFGAGETVRTDTPLFLGPADGPEEDLCVLLPELLERLASESRLVKDNLLRLEGQVRRLADEADGPMAARELFARAADAMLDELSLGDEDAASLAEELTTMTEGLPEGGRFLPLLRRLPLDLLRQAVDARVTAARKETLGEVRRLVTTLEGLLAADDRRRRGVEPDALAGTLGALGSRMVRTENLSGIVGPRRGGELLDDGLRRRLEEAEEAMSELSAGPEPPVLCTTDGGLRELLGAEELSHWEVVVSDDPCREAASRFEEAAESIARLVRAARLTKLATDGRYEPAKHDDWLAQLDWQSLEPRELATAPPVVALVSADDVAREGMMSLSSLLLSGRPVQVLVFVRPGSSPGAEEDPLSGFRFEPGYQGLGHREAFVSQTSPVRPNHMMATFRRGVAATRAALHVVAELPEDDRPPGRWLRAAAALEGRAHPLFRYDPEAGGSWARRLDFTDNPGPDVEWPSADDEDAGEFTFGHYALLEPEFSRHFAPVPDEVPDEALRPLSEWLDLGIDERVGVVPFVDAGDRDRRFRLAVTRHLAFATRDRLSFWRTLQELAGVRSEYADRAAAEARREAEERARQEWERLTAAHAGELERVKATAVREAAERITSALLDVDPAVFESTRPPAEAFRGRDADEVSSSLLAILGDVDALGEEGREGQGPSEETDRLAARLLQIIDLDTVQAAVGDRDDS